MRLDDRVAIAALLILLCTLAVTERPRRARGVPITTRRTQTGPALLSRMSAGGRGVSAGRICSRRGSLLPPPDRSERHPAPALHTPRPLAETPPPPSRQPPRPAHRAPRGSARTPPLPSSERPAPLPRYACPPWHRDADGWCLDERPHLEAHPERER